SSTYPVATIPANTFNFSTTTGQMSFVPAQIQQGVTAIRVDEYRNGVLIGSVVRDIQMMIINCQGNVAPVISAATIPTGANVIGPNSYRVCVGSTLQFSITATDANTGTIIGMTSTASANLPGAVFTTTGTNPKTGILTWSPSANDVGNKTFTITITDNACPIPIITVIGFTVNIVKGDINAADFTVCPGVTTSIQLNATASGGVGCSGNCYSWYPTTNLSSTTIPNPIATVSTPSTYYVSYNDGTCVLLDTVNILPEGSVTITPDDTLICIGKSVVLNAPNTFPNAQNISCGLNNAPCSGSLNTIQIDTMNTNTNVTGANLGVGSPFQGDYDDGRVQYLYKKTELQLAGVSAGLLRSIAFNVTHQLSTAPYKNFTIKIGCTSLTAMSTATGFVTTNMSTVYSSAFTPLSGWNIIYFNTPFQWDGNSNIIVEVCFDNTSSTNFDHVEYTNSSFNSVLYSRANTSSGCSLASPIVSTRRPNVQFTNCLVASPVTYTWTTIFGNGTSSMTSTTSSAPSVHPNDTTIYVVSVSNGVCVVKDTAVVYTRPVATMNSFTPVYICPDDTVVFYPSGNAYVNYFSYGGNAIDSLLVSPIVTTTYNIVGHTNCGNIIRPAVVNVVDSIPPVIVNCPSSVTYYNTPTTCTVPHSWTAPTAVDNCPRFNMTQTTGLASGSQFPVGTTTITYDAVDQIGNHTLCTFNVTVIDTIKPIILNCPANITINANPNICKGTATWIAPTVSDNCPNATIVKIQGANSGTLFNVGTTSIKYKATDASGNESFCEFTITVLDTQAPNIVNLPANITVNNTPDSCSATVSWTVPTPTDNCTGAAIAQTGGLANGSIFPLGTSTIQYTATDLAGNATTQTFTITVLDNQAPTFSGCLSDSTLKTDLGMCSAVFSWQPLTANDNCQGAVGVTQFTGQASGSTFGIGTHIISYFTMDNVGNADTCTFTLYVKDKEAPVISGCPGNLNIPKDTNACGATVVWAEPTATDNCGLLSFTQTSGLPNGSFFPLGPTDIVYTAIDSAGNASICLFQIFISDAAFPVITGCPQNIVLNNDVGVCGAVATWTEPIATDNCPGVNLVASQNNGTVFPIGTTMILYTAMDAALNVTTCSFTVTVNDTELPTITNCPADTILGNTPSLCGAIVSWNMPMITDNCPNLQIVNNFNPSDTFPIGTTTVIYTATDASGNVSTCSFDITVNDTEAPMASNCPSDIVQSSTATSCDATVNWTPPTFADNCALASVVSNYNPGDIFPSGITVVTYTATDNVGNTSACSFVVTINDSIPPIISNCPANIVLSADANCEAIANWVAPTASDNCPNLSFTSNYNSGDVFLLGVTQVIYVALDGAGNQDSCTFTVTVLDNTPPVLANCPANIVYQVVSRCDTTINWIPPTLTDNCSGASMTSNFQPNDVFTAGTTTTVIYTAIDTAGNVTTCQFDVTILPPNPLVATSTILSNVHCLNGSDGSIMVAMTGGSGNYSYSWNTVPPQLNDTATNLPLGTYTVFVIDDSASACVNPVSSTTTITQMAVLDVVATGTNPTCYGFANGQITATASAGTPPYSYSWASGQQTAQVNNVPIGTYLMYVTDSKNCIDTASITLTQPDSLSGSFSQINVDCKGNKTGMAQISMTGGTPAYSYAWSNNKTTPQINNLGAGIYTVTVTDDNNCVYTHTYNVTEPDELLIATTQTPVICRNSATATATVSIQGGTPAYTVSWTSTPSQNTLTATNLPSGIYKVFVTDAQGCKKVKQVYFTNPAELSVVLEDTLPVYCDWANGMIQVKAKGGLPPYTYIWDTNPTQTGEIASNLYEGTYQVLVTDSLGCTDSLTRSLKNVPPAIPSFESVPPYTAPVLLSQANIQFVNTSVGAIAYSWDFGDVIFNTSDKKNPKHEFLETGTYTVTLTAYNKYYECPTEFKATYEIIFDGAAFLPNTFTPNGDGINDFFGVYGDGLVSVNLQIFDRWGKKIFQTNQIGDSWDGTKDGQNMPEGAYTYQMEAIFNDGKKLSRGGTILIIR
ncbi:MAG: HYR domain-containing protein, partial [Bacteroidia bacterium]